MQTQHDVVEVFDAGVDWISFTVPRLETRTGELVALWKIHQEEEKREYGDFKETAPQGYKGHKSRHWFFGEREGEYFFQTSSAPAREAAACLAEFGGRYNVTRCDYQTTLRETGRNAGHFARYRDELRRRESAEGRTRRTATQLYESDSGGDSISFNSKSSKRALTIYDKSAESKNALGLDLTRYELRCRQQQAKETFSLYRKSKNKPAFSQALVADMMRRVGFPVDWPEAENGICLPSSYEKSDEQRRFDWLMSDPLKAAAKIEDADKRKILLDAFRSALLS